MILASAMRHSVGRPAHGNGGRHEKSYGAALPTAVRSVFENISWNLKSAPLSGADFVDNASHRETH